MTISRIGHPLLSDRVLAREAAPAEKPRPSKAASAEKPRPVEAAPAETPQTQEASPAPERADVQHMRQDPVFERAHRLLERLQLQAPPPGLEFISEGRRSDQALLGDYGSRGPLCRPAANEGGSPLESRMVRLIPPAETLGHTLRDEQRLLKAARQQLESLKAEALDSPARALALVEREAILSAREAALEQKIAAQGEFVTAFEREAVQNALNRLDIEQGELDVERDRYGFEAAPPSREQLNAQSDLQEAAERLINIRRQQKVPFMGFQLESPERLLAAHPILARLEAAGGEGALKSFASTGDASALRTNLQETQHAIDLVRAGLLQKPERVWDLALVVEGTLSLHGVSAEGRELIAQRSATARREHSADEDVFASAAMRASLSPRSSLLRLEDLVRRFRPNPY